MATQVDLKTIPVSPTDGDKEPSASTDSGDPVTVFHDKENFNVKHPLMNKWTLWFTKPASGKVCDYQTISAGWMNADKAEDTGRQLE